MKAKALCLVGLLLASVLLAGCVGGTGEPSSQPDGGAASSDASEMAASVWEASGSEGGSVSGAAAPSSSALTAAQATSSTAQASVPAQNAAPAVTQEPTADPSPATSPAVTSALPAQPQEEPQPGRIAVTLSVDCRTAVEAGYADAVETAPDGEILAGTRIVLEEGATVYDLLQHSGLDVEVNSSITGTYVTEIQFLKEKQCGPASGWMYSVNGSFPGKSCDRYKLKDGDMVAFRYTCANGSDLK